MQHRWAVAAAIAGAAVSFVLVPWPVAGFAAVLAALAVYVAAVDLDRFIIPDIANLAIGAAGFALVVVEGGSAGALSGLESALLRTLAAGGFLWTLRFLYARATGIEGLGLAPRGGAGELIRSGATRPGGRLPINTNGGLLSEGYLHGMNTVAEAVLQMQGRCGDRTVPGAETCVVTSGALTDGSALVLSKG